MIRIFISSISLAPVGGILSQELCYSILFVMIMFSLIRGRGYRILVRGRGAKLRALFIVLILGNIRDVRDFSFHCNTIPYIRPLERICKNRSRILQIL